MDQVMLKLGQCGKVRQR